MTIKIGHAIAWALVADAIGVRAAEVELGRVERERDATLVCNGCKVRVRARGAVRTYTLSGYDFEGRDVRDALRTVVSLDHVASALLGIGV